MERGEITALQTWGKEAWCPQAGNDVPGAKQVAPKMSQKEGKTPHWRPLTFDLGYPIIPIPATRHDSLLPRETVTMYVLIEEGKSFKIITSTFSFFKLLCPG